MQGLAHDLALRGLRVTLVERGEVTSGTSGRHHGLLHSGARYAVGDREAGLECIQENTILKRIAPGTFECNDGLFVAVCDEDLEYLEPLVEGCIGAEIPVQRLTAAEALRLEPCLTPEVRAAVRVPDATVDPMRLILRFFATARHNGADIRPYTEVTGLIMHDGLVSGAEVRDHVTGKIGEIHADLVVNAAGPWSGKVADMAGASVPIAPSPGVLLALHGRFCNMVINRMHKSGDGDIVVPQRGLSIVGTTSWVVEDPDDLSVPEDHVERMYIEGSKLIPALRDASSTCRVVGGPPAGRVDRRGHRTRAVAHLPDLRPPRARRRRGLRDDHRRQVHHAARHGRGVRRPGLPQAGHRRALPHARPVLLPHTAYYAALAA